MRALHRVPVHAYGATLESCVILGVRLESKRRGERAQPSAAKTHIVAHRQLHQLLEQLLAGRISPNLTLDSARQQNVVALARGRPVHFLNNLLTHRERGHFSFALLAFLARLELLKISVCSKRTEVLPRLVVEEIAYLAVERRL